MAVAIFVGGDLVRWRELAVPPRREGGLIRKGRDSSGSGSGRYRSGSSCLVGEATIIRQVPIGRLPDRLCDLPGYLADKKQVHPSVVVKTE